MCMYIHVYGLYHSVGGLNFVVLNGAARGLNLDPCPTKPK